MIQKKEHIISVIIPIYNVAHYLKRCVDSLLEQTYPQMEIILIDDGSTDESGRIADKLAEGNSNVIAVHQKNKGVSAARNIGLRCATGDYIAFVDPDDYVDKEMYDCLYEKMIAHHADVAACTFINEYENHEKKTVRQGIDAILSGEEAVAYDLLQGMYITWNKLFSRKVCLSVYYDEQIINGEDRLFDVQALLHSSRVIYVNKAFYHYYHRPNSAGTKCYTSKDASLLIACKKISNLVDGRSETLKNVADMQMVMAYMQLIDMMGVNVDRYPPDGRMYWQEIKKSLWNIMRNPQAGKKNKIRVFLMSISPFIYRYVMKIWGYVKKCKQ